MANLYAGTSGFAYPAWKPAFYPEKLPARRFLEHYAQRLNTVEINYTFNRLASAKTIEGWVQTVRAGFLFAVKAHMRITHALRLREAAECTAAFLRSIEPLSFERRLGPVLFQLPPNLKADVALLSDYLELLPPELRCAFEFRHESWLNEEVYGALRRRNVALCIAESEKLQTPDVQTADFAYFRFRKPEYGDAEMAEIAGRVRTLLGRGLDVFTMFKHEESPEGALRAERLLANAQLERASGNQT